MIRKWSFLFLVSLILVGCTEDDEDEQQPVSNDPTLIQGRFSNNLSCTVTSVPSTVGLSSYYSKYLNCSGIPVIGTSDVPDEAFYAADETVEFMLTDMAAIRTQLVSDGNYIVLYPEGGCIDDLPEPFVADCEFNQGAYTWQGPGENQVKAIANDIESLLCSPNIPSGNILVHEMAHMIHIGALRLLDNSFNSELSGIYNQSMSSGNWNETYGTTNREELLAEAVTIYYGVNYIGPEGGDGFRNDIGSRADLQERDVALYNFVNEHFYGGTDIPGCKLPLIAGVTANCPAVMYDIDGNEYEVVNIGPKCWMKENLKTTRYRDGSLIANITDDQAWVDATTGAWSDYNNDPANDDIYGKLYNGYAFKSGKLCPQGWHAPDFQELQLMINYAGGDQASAAIRSLDLWNNGVHTNMSNFTALPAGRRNGDEGFFYDLGQASFFGSSTVSIFQPEKFNYKSLFSDNPYIYNDRGTNSFGVSCRCVQD